MNNRYAKSCVRVYNPVDQAFAATAAPLVLKGTTVVNTGCSLCAEATDIKVLNSGLYHISADVTITPTASGIVTIQLYKDGVALPCAIVQQTVTSGDAYALHVETDACINTCCMNNPLITVQLSGVSGNVNELCVGMLKLA